jgi:hypothetical protein
MKGLIAMDNWRFEKMSPEKYREWFNVNRLLLQHRSPFHDPHWLETVERAANVESGYVGVYEGRDLTAVIPGFLAWRGPFLLYGSPLNGMMTSYVGPVSPGPLWLEQRQMELLIACASFVRKTWGPAHIRFALGEAPTHRQNLNGNWKDRRPGTYRLNLSIGIEELWKGLESECRMNVRRAQDAGMSIVPFRDASLFYRTIDESFGRQNAPNWQKTSFFQSFFNQIGSHDMLWAWGVKYEGNIIAGALFLHDDQDIIFIGGASLPQFSSLPTRYLLHWSAIELAAKMGIRTFHWNKRNIQSLDRFKESWGPALEERYTLIWAPGYSYVRSARKLFTRAVSSTSLLARRLKTENQNL